jgi:hypothetical protein
MKKNMLIGLAYGRQCRVVVLDSCDIVQEVTSKHGTKPTASAALGRSLSAGLLLASSLKGEKKLSLMRPPKEPFAAMFPTPRFIFLPNQTVSLMFLVPSEPKVY